MALRLGVVTDVHWSARPAPEAWHNPYDFAGLASRLRAAAEWFAQADVGAVALLGDLSDGGAGEEIAAPLRALAGGGRPVLAVPGNHDLMGDEHALAAVAGDVGGEVHAAPFAWPAGELLVVGVALASDDRGLTVRGALPAPDEAPPDAPVLVLSHYPMISQAAHLAEHGFAYPGDLLDRARLEAQLAARPAVVLHGHVHARVAARAAGILQLGFTALVEHPAEAAILEIDTEDGRLTVRREVRGLGRLEHHRTPVLDAGAAWRWDGERWHAAAGDGAAAPR